MPNALASLKFRGLNATITDKRQRTRHAARLYQQPRPAVIHRSVLNTPLFCAPLEDPRMADNAKYATAPALASISDIDLSTLVEETVRSEHRSSASRTNPRFYNWAKTFTCAPEAIFYPTDEQQVRYVVELARRKSKHLRAFGAGHSPSDLVCVQRDDWLLQTDGLDRLIEVDQTNKTVTVQGGIRLRDLHPLLRKHGLALSSLGSISDQSLAGAISTATHGSSLEYGNLSSCVRAVTVVTAQPGAPLIETPDDSANASNTREGDDDKERQLDRESLFQVSRCALGLSGIITALTIQCEKSFNLQEEIFAMQTDNFIRSLRGIIEKRDSSIAHSAQHVRAWWHPQAREVRVSRMNRTRKASTVSESARKSRSVFTRLVDGIKDWISSRVIGYHWHQLGLVIGRVFPSFLTMHARFVYAATSRPGCFLDTTPIHDFRNHTYSNVLFDIDDELPTSSEKTPLLNHQKEESAGSLSRRRGSALDPAWPRCSPTTTRIGDSVSIFNYDCLFPQYTYEGVVPLERAADCLTEMKDWLEGEMLKSGGLRHHFPIEIRFSPKDDVWMSPTYEMDGCYIGIVQYKPYSLPVTYRKLFERFESILFSHGGKPHWAKSHSASQVDLKRMFPRLDELLRIRQIVDPKGVFLNPYAKRHLLDVKDEPNSHVRFKTSAQALEDTLHMQ